MVKIICLQLKNEILYVSVAQILLELWQKTKCYVFMTFVLLLNKFVNFFVALSFKKSVETNQRWVIDFLETNYLKTIWSIKKICGN